MSHDDTRILCHQTSHCILRHLIRLMSLETTLHTKYRSISTLELIFKTQQITYSLTSLPVNCTKGTFFNTTTHRLVSKVLSGQNSYVYVKLLTFATEGRTHDRE